MSDQLTEPTQSVQPTSTFAAPRFTLIDWAGVVAVLVALALLAAVPVKTFANMFQDFGARQILPRATLLVLKPWSRPVLALPAVLLLGLTAWAARKNRGWRSWLVGAVVLGFAAPALCLYALYLPIWQMADNIKP